MKRRLGSVFIPFLPILLGASLLGSRAVPAPPAPCSSGYTDTVIKQYNKKCRLFKACALWKAGKIIAMPNEQFMALHKAMRDWWNWMVGNSWAKVGPRYFNFGAAERGNVLAPGTRLFYSVMPSHENSRTLRLTHVGGKSRAIVDVCVVDPNSGRPASAKRWDIPKNDRLGKTFAYTIRSVNGKFVFVNIAGKTWSRNFKYKLQVD